MKRFGVLSTAALLLLLGSTASAYARQEQHEQEAKPEHQQEAKPEKQQEAKPEKQQEAKPVKQEAAKPVTAAGSQACKAGTGCTRKTAADQGCEARAG